MSRIERISSSNRINNKRKPYEGKVDNNKEDEFDQKRKNYRKSLKVEDESNKEIKEDTKTNKEEHKHTKLSEQLNTLMQRKRLGLDKEERED